MERLRALELEPVAKRQAAEPRVRGCRRRIGLERRFELVASQCEIALPVKEVGERQVHIGGLRMLAAGALQDEPGALARGDRVLEGERPGVAQGNVEIVGIALVRGGQAFALGGRGPRRSELHLRGHRRRARRRESDRERGGEGKNPDLGKTHDASIRCFTTAGQPVTLRPRDGPGGSVRRRGGGPHDDGSQVSGSPQEGAQGARQEEAQGEAGEEEKPLAREPRERAATGRAGPGSRPRHRGGTPRPGFVARREVRGAPGALAYPPPSTLFTTSCTRLPSARPAALAITAFMTCPMAEGPEAPVSATAPRTSCSSSTSPRAAGR